MRTTKNGYLRLVAVFAMLTAGLLIHGCADERDVQTDAPLPGVRSEMLVSTAELEPELGKPGLVVVHVADDRSVYDSLHVPGAAFLAWDDLAVSTGGALNEMPPADSLTAIVQRLGIGPRDRVVFYDEQDGRRSARGWVTMDYLGLGPNAAILDGQWKKWKAESRPVSTELPQVEPSDYVPRHRPEKLMGMEEVSGLAESGPQAPVLVDSRPARYYTGEEPGGGVPAGRAGHIPGAINVPWTEHLAEGELPVLKPARELMRLYQAVGLNPEDEVVAYCRTGRAASHSYFVLSYLGYDVRLYDGSFYEWSNSPDKPVERGGGE